MRMNIFLPLWKYVINSHTILIASLCVILKSIILKEKWKIGEPNCVVFGKIRFDFMLITPILYMLRSLHHISCPANPVMNHFHYRYIHKSHLCVYMSEIISIILPIEDVFNDYTLTGRVWECEVPVHHGILTLSIGDRFMWRVGGFWFLAGLCLVRGVSRPYRPHTWLRSVPGKVWQTFHELLEVMAPSQADRTKQQQDLQSNDACSLLCL